MANEGPVPHYKNGDVLVSTDQVLQIHVGNMARVAEVEAGRHEIIYYVAIQAIEPEIGPFIQTTAPQSQLDLYRLKELH